MDALKRAEKAREAQAQEAVSRDAKDDVRPTELSLDPMEVAADDSAAHTTGTMSVEDSLELTPDEVKREIESMEDTSMDAFAGNEAELELAVESLPDDSMSLEYGDVPLDETGSTLPSVRAAQRSVQDYFDGTSSLSMSLQSVRESVEADDESPAADAVQAEREADGGTTSRRRAQAVIDAHTHAPSHTVRNTALVLVALLLIGGVGGGVFLFKDKIMAMLDGQPALVAQQPARPAAAVAAGTDAPAPAPEALAANEREALLRAAEQARAEEAAREQAQAAAQEKLRAEAEMQARAIADATAAQARIEAAAEEQRRAAQAQIAKAAAASTQAGAAAGSVHSTASAPSAFKISKRRGVRRVHTDLVRGFEAFQSGDDVQAMQAYRAALQREPRNRDAMLGVAAVSLRTGNLQQAASYYAEVLRRNPRDSAAQAGLIALQENLDPISGESRVKEMLARSPADANLNFSLGNLYAEQGRWPEAQQSYFEAYRLDNANPDYAFNLAVSLDQLSQSKPALEYYRRAEQLAGQSPATFDLAVAQRRAAELAGL